MTEPWFLTLCAVGLTAVVGVGICWVAAINERNSRNGPG